MPAGVLFFVLLFFRVFGGENNKIEAILVILSFIFRKNNKSGCERGQPCTFFLQFRGNSCTKRLIYAIFGLFLQKNVHVASLKNGMCIIVTHFYRQQLYKNAGLCNCQPFFKQTIIQWATEYVIVPIFQHQQLQKNANFCNCWAFFRATITEKGFSSQQRHKNRAPRNEMPCQITRIQKNQNYFLDFLAFELT